MTPGAPDERAARGRSRGPAKAEPTDAAGETPTPASNAAAARRKPAQSPVKKTPATAKATPAKTTTAKTAPAARKPAARRTTTPARAAAAAAAPSTVSDQTSEVAETEAADDTATSAASPSTAAAPEAAAAPKRAPRKRAPAKPRTAASTAASTEPAADEPAAPADAAPAEAPPAPKPRTPRTRKPAAGPTGSRSAATTGRPRAVPATAARAATPPKRQPTRPPVRSAPAAAAPVLDAVAEPLLEPVLEPVADPVAAPEPSHLPDLKLVPALDVHTEPVRKPARPVRTVRPKSRPVAPPETAEVTVEIIGLTKRYGTKAAVADIDLRVRAGSFYGIVGPNGAGKTTTLSMLTGLVRPDSGRILVDGVDVWAEPKRAKQAMGVLPDRLRLFDRLTGAQLLEYSGSLRGLDRATRRRRAQDLAAAFELTASLDRFVADYSAGMTKKIALAAAMIHSPRVLVLDEPFESVDPVSAAVVVGILQRFTAAGGTVLMSSHSMELIERVCDSVAVIVDGGVLASGSLVEVLQGRSLEDRFVELAGGTRAVEGMEWLQSFSD